jgi:hypothetical protein
VKYCLLPTRMIVVLAVFLASVLLPAAVAPAWQRIGDVEVIVEPLPNMERSTGRERGVTHGYVEYRVRVKNLSTKDHTVILRYPATPSYDRTAGAAVSRTVLVTGGQESSVSLFEPPSGSGETLMEVRVDGEEEPRKIPVENLRRWRYGSSYGEELLPAVLLSRGVPQDFRERGSGSKEAVEEIPPTSGTGGRTSSPDRVTFLRSDVSVSRWSPNWLGYSCYDAILLTQREAEEMPGPAQTAIRRYVECGGVLWVHGRSVPAAFSRGGIADGQGGFHVGFGRVQASSTDREPSWEETYRRLVHNPLEVYRPSQRPSQLYDLLVGETTVPVRGLFLLVLLFAVTIGPVNIWLLSRYRRRIWLWWNVPAISLLTCMAVFCYSMFSEGWRARGKTATLTVLDERDHRATTIGYVSYYCPLTPSGGLHFGTDTEVTLLSREDPYRYGRYPRPDVGLSFVDWTSDQHLTSGWVSSRVPAYFQIRKNEDRRERLTVEKTAEGSLKVVNALGADIRRLRVADAAGQAFEGQDIPAGAERTLTRVPRGESAVMNRDALRAAFNGSEWLGQFEHYRDARRLGSLLAPGGYVAILDKSPFVESPLPGASCQDTVAIVFGISKAEDNAH